MSSNSLKPSNPKDVLGVRKVPMSTVPATVLAEIGVAMLEGGCKYGRHNFRAVGVRASAYYDATQRHLMAWWEGEDDDADSGMSHITKAITSLVVLRDAMIQSMMTDDRPPRSATFYERLNKLSGEILDRHADKSPRHYTEAESVADERAKMLAIVKSGVMDPGAAAADGPDGWIAHDGGPCPVPVGTLVEVRLRAGSVHKGQALEGLCLCADQWFTGYRDDPTPSDVDIVAYRVLPS